MRLTLKELKAMSDRQLFTHWELGKFPFEMARCGQCATMHIEGYCRQHEFSGISKPLASAIKLAMRYGTPTNAVGGLFRKHLEELYALRLFYDPLYPPSVEPACEPDEAPASVLRGGSMVESCVGATK